MLERCGSALLSAIVAVSGLAISATWAAPASAASVVRSAGAAAPTLPTSVSTDVLPTVQINGVVWRQVIVGNTVYVGGDFSSARPAGSAAGVNETPRSNMLAYNLTTGELITSFAPTFDGKVVDLAVTPDQTKLVAVGPFTTVDGQARSRVAVFDLPSATLSSTSVPTVNGGIETVAATNSTIYLGGYFSSVNGASRARLAAVRTSNGQVLPFRPTVDNGDVQSIVVAPDQASVVVSGNFTSVEGSGADSGYGLARLNADSGRKLALPVNAEFRDGGQNSGVMRLATDGTRFYGVGWVYGGGGNAEGFFAANWSDGKLAWLEDCHGDTYDIAPVGNVVYTVSHAHYCGNSGGFPQTSPGTNRHTLAWTNDVVRGTNKNDIYNYADHPGTPRPELLNFFPAMVAGTYTSAAQAGWTVTGNSDYVLVGGEFTKVAGVAQQGLVRFRARSAAANKRGPRLTSTGWAPTVRSYDPGAVRVQWQPNVDEDDATLRYQVFRGTTSNVVYETTQTARFWESTPMSFTDSGLTPGSTVQYRVRAIDPDGNIASSDWVSVTVASTSTVDDYARTVLRDGATKYWRLDEGSGSQVNDTVGTDSPTAGSGLGRNAPGALRSSSDTASTFDGTASGRVVSTQKVAGSGPQKFSVEAWFKTSATTGGKIVGYGQSATSTSSTTYDRDLFLDSSRRVSFSLNGASRVTLRTPTSYNDGAWHQAVGTFSQAQGMALYVDGKLVSTDTSLPAVKEYVGYWRVGGDASSSGAQNFTGSIDEAAVYQDVLSPQQVNDHWVASGRPSATVNDAPVASYTRSSTGLLASFDASASTDPDGSIASYAWSYGDGTTGTGSSSQHTYAKAGKYQVTLTVTDNLGATSTFTLALTVTTANQAPTPVFTTTADGLTASFDGSGSTDPDGTVASYAWDFGDGTTGAGSTTQHTYAAAGTYRVSLTVTDNAGAAASSTTTVSVVVPNKAPTAAFTSTYRGLTASLDGSGSTDSDGSVASYAWDFGDGTAGSGPTPQHNYAASGTYQVVLTVTDDDGATSSATRAVKVGGNVAPASSFAVTTSGLTGTFDASGSSDPDGSLVSYAWDFGDGTSTVQGVSPRHDWTFGGTYQVTLTVTDDGGATATSRQTVTVAPTGVLASDSFARSTTGGWGNADAGGAWTVRGASSGFAVSGGAGVLKVPSGATLSSDLLGVSSQRSRMVAEFSVDKNVEGGYVTLVGRQVGSDSYAARLRLAADGSARLYLLQTANGVGSSYLLPFAVQPGAKYKFALQVTGTSPTTLSAKVWKSSDQEPATWQLSSTNSFAALQAAGRAGVLSYLPGSASASAPLTTSFYRLLATEVG